MTGFKRKMEIIASTPQLALRLRDERALTPQEEVLYSEFYGMLIRQLGSTYGWNEAEATQMAHHYEGLIGKSALLRLMTEPTPVLGVPYDFFVVNILATFFVFSVTQVWFSLPITLVILHITGILVYLIRRPQILQREIETIRKKGLHV